MNLTRRYLAEMMGKEILVVTVDSRTFAGTLLEFDTEALIMRDVIETSTREIKWHRPSVTMPMPGSSTAVKRELSELMIPIHALLRVWKL